MRHLQNAPRKPLLTSEEAINAFMSLFTDFDEPNHIKIAKLIFVDGLTDAEVGEQVGYSERHISRLRQQLLKVTLKRALKAMSKQECEDFKNESKK